MWYILNITSPNDIFSKLYHAFSVSVSFHDIISCDVINAWHFWYPFTPVIKAGGIDPTHSLLRLWKLWVERDNWYIQYCNNAGIVQLFYSIVKFFLMIAIDTT